MSELLAMSFDAPASPSIFLKPWIPRQTAEEVPTGWGFAWYPSGENAAAVVKDPLPAGDTSLSRVLRDWERFRSTLFLCHIRGAAKRVSQEDTHPFSRSHAGRDWLLAHNGDLDPRGIRELALGEAPIFEPVGRTDSEHAFCWLLTELFHAGARMLADIPWADLHARLSRLDELGTLNLLLTDGHDLVAYRDSEGFNRLNMARYRPPHEKTRFGNRMVEVDISDPLDLNRTAVIVATTPLDRKGWQGIPNGEMVVIRRGTVRWQSWEQEGDRTEGGSPDGEGASWREVRGQAAAGSGPEADGGQASSLSIQPARRMRPAPSDLEPPDDAAERQRVVEIRHETVYTYTDPVERSTHVFRLRPVHDLQQEVLSHALEITPPGESLEFEDVFGNQTLRMALRDPFTEMRIVSTSRVRILAPRGVSSVTRRQSLPLVWMPWQRHMMQPYLLPPELPETQLRELSEYAMAFAERQDHDLTETLTDINRTIRLDFAYVSQSTHLETTPFDVYVNRRGVCQDFANLLICLARLLGVPARYRVGYIHTGADYSNPVQSEASHAWAEFYLPWAGWRGYDPTNGCEAGLDHIRVAAGRNYRDATPTSGTIYKGGGTETLHVSVRVQVEEAPSGAKEDREGHPRDRIE